LGLGRKQLLALAPLVAEALAEGGLDRLAPRPWYYGEAPSLRWILLHMIEEYARHSGGADLLLDEGTCRPAPNGTSSEKSEAG
jgi:hypothetical protein